MYKKAVGTYYFSKRTKGTRIRSIDVRFKLEMKSGSHFNGFEKVMNCDYFGLKYSVHTLHKTH